MGWDNRESKIVNKKKRRSLEKINKSADKTCVQKIKM